MMLLVDFTLWKIDTEKLFLCEYNTFASKKSLNEPMAIVYIESSNWIETNQIKLAFLLTTASCATQIYLGCLMMIIITIIVIKNSTKFLWNKFEEKKTTPTFSLYELIDFRHKKVSFILNYRETSETKFELMNWQVFCV